MRRERDRVHCAHTHCNAQHSRRRALFFSILWPRLHNRPALHFTSSLVNFIGVARRSSSIGELFLCYQLSYANGPMERCMKSLQFYTRLFDHVTGTNGSEQIRDVLFLVHRYIETNIWTRLKRGRREMEGTGASSFSIGGLPEKKRSSRPPLILLCIEWASGSCCCCSCLAGWEKKRTRWCGPREQNKEKKKRRRSKTEYHRQPVALGPPPPATILFNTVIYFLVHPCPASIVSISIWRAAADCFRTDRLLKKEKKTSILILCSLLFDSSL